MSTHSIHRLLSLGALSASLLIPAGLVAQTAVAPEITVTSAPAQSSASLASTDGPRITQAGVTRSSATAAAPAPQQFRGDRRDVAWMVVGGAALVVGSMVGGDGGTIIMITGGVIGLMGLFRYMQ